MTSDPMNPYDSSRAPVGLETPNTPPAMDFRGISDGHTSPGFHLQPQVRWYDDYTTTGDINTLAGNLPNQGWKAVDHQAKIFFDEVTELMVDGIMGRDIHELRDGIADAYFTLVGLAHRAGIDMPQDYALVVASNLSKFDTSITDALATRAKYAAIGVPTYFVEQTRHGKPVFITLCEETVKGTDGKQYRKDKWLKSHNWAEPEFELLPLEHPLVESLHSATAGPSTVTPAYFLEAAAKAQSLFGTPVENALAATLVHAPTAEVSTLGISLGGPSLAAPSAGHPIDSPLTTANNDLQDFLLGNERFRHAFAALVRDAAVFVLETSGQTTIPAGRARLTFATQVARLAVRSFLHEYPSDESAINAYTLPPVAVSAAPLDALYQTLLPGDVSDVASALALIGKSILVEADYAVVWYSMLQSAFSDAFSDMGQHLEAVDTGGISDTEYLKKHLPGGLAVLTGNRLWAQLFSAPDTQEAYLDFTHGSINPATFELTCGRA